MKEKHYKPNFRPGHLINAFNEFYLDLLGYKSERTNLIQMDYYDWIEFCLRTRHPKQMNDIYVSRSETVISRTDTKYSALNIFYEYYGHGLFGERTLLDKTNKFKKFIFFSRTWFQ